MKNVALVSVKLALGHHICWDQWEYVEDHTVSLHHIPVCNKNCVCVLCSNQTCDIGIAKMGGHIVLINAVIFFKGEGKGKHKLCQNKGEGQRLTEKRGRAWYYTLHHVSDVTCKAQI